MFSLIIPAALAQKPITLHECLPDGSCTIPVSTTTLETLNAFLRPLIPWIIGVSAGFAVLMVVVGGIFMIVSDGDQGKIQLGRQMMVGSIAGLIILVFSATILNALNADFFCLGPC